MLAVMLNALCFVVSVWCLVFGGWWLVVGGLWLDVDCWLLMFVRCLLNG